MENWTEIRTAFLLGELGTVSATADTIGVHRATVVRRIESLEARLGAKLFQRHLKGYTPTALGDSLIEVAKRSDDGFRSLLSKARGNSQPFDSELVVSSPMLLDHFAFAAIRAFKRSDPKVSVHFQANNEVPKLEYGDADVALTFGEPPSNPDYVVILLGKLRLGLFRSMHTYLETHEDLGTADALAEFIKCDLPVYGEEVSEWVDQNVDDGQVVMTSSSVESANDAVLAGLGTGFLPYFLGRSVTWLKEVTTPDPAWRVPVWIVTHVDVHRTPKVHSFLRSLKSVPRVYANTGRAFDGRGDTDQGPETSNGTETVSIPAE